jgi:hypothetical protein
MGGLQSQKIYTSEEQRRKDQRGDKEPEQGQGLLSMFNDWASEKTETYRRAVFRRAAELELRIENALEQVTCSARQDEWKICLDELTAQRSALKVGHSERAFQDCYKAKQLENLVRDTAKACSF